MTQAIDGWTDDYFEQIAREVRLEQQVIRPAPGTPLRGFCPMCQKVFSTTTDSYDTWDPSNELCPSCFHYGQRMT